MTYVEARIMLINVRNQNSLMGSAETKPPRRTTVDHVSARKPTPATTFAVNARIIAMLLMRASGSGLPACSAAADDPPSCCPCMTLLFVVVALSHLIDLPPANCFYIYLLLQSNR